jgi:hypothetical protein
VVLEYLARSLERGLRARERTAAAHFIDVDYRALTAEPMREIARIYDHYGLSLDRESENAMAGFLAANPQNKHGAHRYSLEEYGLTTEAVRDRLRFYLERFDLRSA